MFSVISWRDSRKRLNITAAQVGSFTMPPWHVLCYLLRSSVQCWDSGVCTALSARLCVWAVPRLTGLPQIMCCELADWPQPFFRNRMQLLMNLIKKWPGAALSRRFTPPDRFSKWILHEVHVPPPQRTRWPCCHCLNVNKQHVRPVTELRLIPAQSKIKVGVGAQSHYRIPPPGGAREGLGLTFFLFFGKGEVIHLFSPPVCG